MDRHFLFPVGGDTNRTIGGFRLASTPTGASRFRLVWTPTGVWDIVKTVIAGLTRNLVHPKSNLL